VSKIIKLTKTPKLRVTKIKGFTVYSKKNENVLHDNLTPFMPSVLLKGQRISEPNYKNM